jgi:nicotinamide riboside kinase
MKIWSEFRYKACSSIIQTAFIKQQFDHYFLCAPDIPWEPDPLREHPEERERLFLLYQAELIQSKRPFTIVSGTMKARQKVVEDVLNRLLIA